jgi:two-component sensor histidine kinase
MNYNTLDELRQNFVNTILKILSAIGFVAYLPSMYYAIVEKIWVIAVIDTLAYLLIVLVAFIKKINVTVKTATLLALAYTLGVSLLIFTGPFGAGIIYLFAFIFITALFFKPKATIFANIIVILTLIGFALLNTLQILRWEQGLQSMIILLANFVLIAFIFSYGLSFLMNKLQDHIDNQSVLHQMLKNEVSQKEFEKTRAEQALETQTRLTKELHHRVKNNLQVVSSLISLHEQKKSAGADRLAGLKERMKAISTLHLLFYTDDNVASLELKKTLDFILDKLILSLQTDNIRFIKNVEVGTAQVSSDTATLVSLVFNEILTNAARHAFPGGREGEIKITVTMDGDRLRISVSDNGIGFDSEDIRQKNSIGLELLHTLLHQLKAEYRLETHGGTHFAIAIPVTAGGIV